MHVLIIGCLLWGLLFVVLCGILLVQFFWGCVSFSVDAVCDC